MATPSVAPARQRVCPHCATVSTAASDARCPWCGRGFRRRLLPALVALAVLQGAALVVAVALMLTSFGSTLEDELDDQVTRVERTFERDLDGLDRDVRRELRRELDARFP